ncbi:hypothetical protein R1sor_014556 [Riccia sorocarpa]|uniref:Septum-promoting GTP-binding protein 1 n=1 Tax=Riccia sorocarpa TaxID=122646 RepID=A0ABD3H9S3_9MARC
MAGSRGRLWRRRMVEESEDVVGQAQEWIMGFAAGTEVVFKERFSKLMFRFRPSSLVTRGDGEGGAGGGGGTAVGGPTVSSKHLTGQNTATGQMRALKRGARRLGRQLRRHSVRSLCCVAGSSRAHRYHKLSRSPSVDSEHYFPSPIAPIAEWPAWGSLGRLANLEPVSSHSCPQEADDTVVVKVSMVGDCQTGKTSFMLNYVASQKNEDYVQTAGVNSMEKIFRVQNANIALSICDIGGHRQFSSMMPLVCKDSDAILLTFDLTRRSTLYSVKQWFVQVRNCNKSAIIILVGTKYDLFVNLPQDMQRIITRQARSYAQAMDASLFFSSVTHSINVHKIFKVIITKLFDLPCNIPKNLTVGEPIIDY